MLLNAKDKVTPLKLNQNDTKEFTINLIKQLVHCNVLLMVKKVLLVTVFLLHHGH